MSKLTDQLQKTISQLGRIAQSATNWRGRQMSVGPKDTSPLPIPAEITRHSTMVDGECVYAIGDIHGSVDLLERLIELIEHDAQTLPSDTEIKLAFLGDYIDLGLQSRQ